MVSRPFSPHLETEIENRVICVRGLGIDKPYQALMVDIISDLQILGNTQCFPFYTYSEEGTNRRENITDWTLQEFRSQYKDETISKWDVFHYVYAVMHHPDYRETYQANLKRELPRIPFLSGYLELSPKQEGDWGTSMFPTKTNPNIHLDFIETPGEPLDWRVEKMRLSKDKTCIRYNDFLTLAGIPPETFDYRLGNRSALDWVINQYLRQDRQTKRHHQRPQSPGRPAIHRQTDWQGNHRQSGNRQTGQGTTSMAPGSKVNNNYAILSASKENHHQT